jgi:hypothetical protein
MGIRDLLKECALQLDQIEGEFKITGIKLTVD